MNEHCCIVFNILKLSTGDSLHHCHNGQQFSTPGNDNDPMPDRDCAALTTSGWWFCSCEDSSLNGKYFNSADVNQDYLGISWDTFGGLRYSHKKSEMKIRPL